jgi:low temperature requirement protein LtrA
MAAFLAAFAGSLAMWWIYFSFTAEAASEAISHAKDPGRVAREAYTYIHLLPIAGVIVTAVGDEWTIHHPLGHTDLKTALAVIGGPFLFLLGGVLFKRAMFRSWPRAQVVGLAALAALAPLSLAVGPLVLSIATTAVLLGVSVREGLVRRSNARRLDV